MDNRIFLLSMGERKAEEEEKSLLYQQTHRGFYCVDF
jgi:hypothetical protein